MTIRRSFIGSTLAMAVGLAAVSGIAAAAAGEATYYLPAPEGTALVVSQGNTDGFQRTDGRVAAERYAFDFVARDDPERFPVLAARGGTVIGQRAGVRGGRCNEPQSGSRPACWRNVNYVLIDHGDGTSGLYLNLRRGDPIVRMGQVVSAGQRIGSAGSSGWTDEVGIRFQVQSTPAWNEVGRGGWFQTRSEPVAFADSDVLVQNPAGVPATDDVVVSGNTGPAFEPFRFGRRPTGLPASVPLGVGAAAHISAAYDPASKDGFGIHLAAPVDSSAAGTEVRPLFGGVLALAGCAAGDSASLGRTVAIEFESGESTYLGVLGHLSDIDPGLLESDPAAAETIVAPGDVVGHYGATTAEGTVAALDCPLGDADADLFASILKDATITADGQIVGGTPISPEPLVGERGYEGFEWWSGPIAAAAVSEEPGRPRARWNGKTASAASHIPFGDSVRLVARVTDGTDIAEVRFRAWYPNWPRPVVSGDLDSFDPATTWRQLAVCMPPGDGAGSDCTWSGDGQRALVTFDWDPMATETSDMEAWLPRARTAMSQSTDRCVPVSLAVEVVDSAGKVYSEVSRLPRPSRCDQRSAERAASSRLVYLDPLVPPATPAVRSNVQNDRGWPPVYEKDLLNGAIVWRDRSSNEDGFRIFARRSWLQADCSVTDGPWQVVTELGPNRDRYRPRHNKVVNSIKVPNIKDVPGNLTQWEYAVAAFNEAGTTRLVPIGKFLGGSEAFCDPGLEPPPDL